MKRRLVALALILPALASHPLAWACDCAVARGGIAGQFARAHVVFTGALASERPAAPGTFTASEWTFDVESVQKGDAGARIRVSAPQGSAACGFDLQPGTRYQVFAFEEAVGGLTTNTCLGTRAVLAVAALAALVWRPQIAWACTCVQSTPDEDFARADVVFVGRAIDHRDPNAGEEIRSSADPIYWTFAVQKVAKGRADRRTEVWTEMTGASCGYGFEKGEHYQVFAGERKRGLHSGLCHGNRHLSGGADAFLPAGLSFYEPGASPPADPPLPRTGAPASPAAAAALLAVAALALRLRRAP